MRGTHTRFADSADLLHTQSVSASANHERAEISNLLTGATEDTGRVAAA